MHLLLVLLLVLLSIHHAASQIEELMSTNVVPAEFDSCLDLKKTYQKAHCCDISSTTDFMLIQPEIDPSGIERISNIPDDTPFYALNLIKIKDLTKLMTYMSYASASLPMFGASGTDFAGVAYSKLIGPQNYDYDFVAIAYYPNTTMFQAYASHLAQNVEMSETRKTAYYYQENIFLSFGFDVNNIVPVAPTYTSCEQVKSVYKNEQCCASTKETDYMIIHPEISNPDGLDGFASRLFKAPNDTPIYALNLIKFKDMDKFAQYGAYTGTELGKFGAYGVFPGTVITKVIGPQEYEYDAAFIVYYPNTTMFYAYAEHLSQNEEMAAIRQASYYYQENIIFHV